MGEKDGTSVSQITTTRSPTGLRIFVEVFRGDRDSFDRRAVSRAPRPRKSLAAWSDTLILTVITVVHSSNPRTTSPATGCQNDDTRHETGSCQISRHPKRLCTTVQYGL